MRLAYLYNHLTCLSYLEPTFSFYIYACFSLFLNFQWCDTLAFKNIRWRFIYWNYNWPNSRCVASAPWTPSCKLGLSYGCHFYRVGGQFGHRSFTLHKLECFVCRKMYFLSFAYKTHKRTLDITSTVTFYYFLLQTTGI